MYKLLSAAAAIATLGVTSASATTYYEPAPCEASKGYYEAPSYSPPKYSYNDSYKDPYKAPYKRPGKVIYHGPSYEDRGGYGNPVDGYVSEEKDRKSYYVKDRIQKKYSAKKAYKKKMKAERKRAKEKRKGKNSY